MAYSEQNMFRLDAGSRERKRCVLLMGVSRIPDSRYLRLLRRMVEPVAKFWVLSKLPALRNFGLDNKKESFQGARILPLGVRGVVQPRLGFAQCPTFYRSVALGFTNDLESFVLCARCTHLSSAVWRRLRHPDRINQNRKRIPVESLKLFCDLLPNWVMT